MHSSKTLALTFSRSGGCKPFPADRRQFTWYSCHRANSGHNRGTIRSNLCRFAVPFNFLRAQIRQYHPDNLALRCVVLQLCQASSRFRLKKCYEVGCRE